MAWCPVCDGLGVVKWECGAPEALKLGERDICEDDCPACDGLGLDSEEMEGEE
jgi:hypothetical protein